MKPSSKQQQIYKDTSSLEESGELTPASSIETEDPRNPYGKHIGTSKHLTVGLSISLDTFSKGVYLSVGRGGKNIMSKFFSNEGSESNAKAKEGRDENE